MLIRRAITRDARAIARVHVRAWQIGYAGMVPDEYLAHFSVESSTRRWLAGLAAPARADTYVAEDDEEQIEGWVDFGVNRNELGTDIGEVYGLYVEPDRWGRGIGSELLAEAERRLAEAGFERAVLWTLEANAATRRFYENRGWHFDGASDTHRSGAAVVRYTRELSNVDRSTGSE